MKLFQRLRRRLFIFQIFLLLIGACCVAYSAQRTFESDLRPDMTQKGALIAKSLAGQFERALEQGIAFDKLRGVDDLFRDVREANSEILFIAAIDGVGRARHAAAFVDGWAKHDKAVSDVMATLPADGDVGEGAEPWLVSWKDTLVASQPAIVGGQCVGWILVGIDADYVKERLAGLLYDILVVLAVSLLMTFELLLLIMTNTGSPMTAVRSMLRQACGFDLGEKGGLGPPEIQVERLRSRLKQLGERLRAHRATLTICAGTPGASAKALQDLGRLDATLTALTLPAAGQPGQGQQESLIRVRMPLFVFFLSEELSRPFFPIYAKSLATSIAGVPTEVVISLPMILFMLVVAFSQPLGGPLAERFGPRRMMLVGSLIGAVGLALTAFAWDFYSLIAWRLTTAVGYGIVFVAGQSHVIAHTDSSNRSWGMAMFVGSVLGASICGPAIGGILADRIGYNWTFAAGALSALSSGVLAWRLLPARDADKRSRGAALRFKDVSLVLGNPRFVALVVGGAMPAKIILTGFLYYLAPLYLAQLGNGPAASGRVVMLYGLMMVLMTPLAARLADRVRRPLLFVIAGGVVSAVGVCGVLWSSTTEMLIVAVLTLGLAQAMSITPQLSLVPVACPAECRQLGQVTVVGFFRLFERIGSALGPLIAAFLLQRCGYETTAGVIGASVAIASIALGIAWSLTARPADLSDHQLEKA